MSWHFLLGQAEESWEDNCLDGAPDALLRLIPIVDQSCLQGNQTDYSQGSQYGMTYAHLTDGHGEDVLMSSVEDSLVKTLVAQVSAKGLPETVRGFGLKCCALLAKLNLSLYSRKTAHTFVPVDLAPLSKDLPAWGMTHDGVCWEIATRAERPLAPECGWFPRLTTKGNETSPSMKKWPTNKNLIAWLPRPTASLYGYNKGGACGRTGRLRPSLEKMMGGIKIAIRELLMDWPIGWTALEQLEMDKYRQWRRLRGRYFFEREEIEDE